MNRRDFLKLGSLLSASAYMSTGPADYLTGLQAETVAYGKVFRGTYNGRIHVSTDNGKTWQLHSNFGPDNMILDIFTGRDGRLYAQLAFKQYTFYLVLGKNEVSWFSQPVQAGILPGTSA